MGTDAARLEGSERREVGRKSSVSGTLGSRVGGRLNGYGNSAFSLSTTGLPKNSLALVLLGNAQDLAGTDTFGLSLAMHVNLPGSTELYALDMPVGGTGIGFVATPIPALPSLSGKTYYAQTIGVGSVASGETCSLGVAELVSSKGLKISIP